MILPHLKLEDKVIVNKFFDEIGYTQSATHC